MDEDALLQARQSAIHLLRSGRSVAEVAEQLGYSQAWVYKWKNRFEASGDFKALHAQSRAPNRRPNATSEPVKRAIRQTRSELEAEAASGQGLTYIGAPTIRARLKKQGITASRAVIERELKAADMTRPWTKKPEKVDYPHLKPRAPHVLCQVDIVPHYLPGGQLIANFNAIDVVSSYASGYSYTNKTSREAFAFLCRLWREQGIARYTQLDNEGCFSGGSTHRYVLGKVLRLGLHVGTELVYSPPYHPQSNGFVERFHQDYSSHVWNRLTLQCLDEVNEGAQRFFKAYRHSTHKRRGTSAAQLHRAPGRLADAVPFGKLPLTEGQAHFIRQVATEQMALAPGHIQVLNVPWYVGLEHAGKGVWATLRFEAPQQAWLRVYDAAPDVSGRTMLASHVFPLKESIHPAESTIQRTWLQRVMRLYRGLLRHAALW